MAYESAFVIRYLGLSYNWFNQIHSIESFKRIVKQRLMDEFIQEWQSRVAENSVWRNYRLFKKKFCFEEYLTFLPSFLRQRVLKFRLSNHRLPIQGQTNFRENIFCTNQLTSLKFWSCVLSDENIKLKAQNFGFSFNWF